MNAKQQGLNPFEIREAGQTIFALDATAVNTSQSLRNQGSRSDSALEIVQC